MLQKICLCLLFGFIYISLFEKDSHIIWCPSPLTVTRRIPLVEQELLILHEYLSWLTIFQWDICYSIFRYLCRVLFTFVCLFSLVIVLSVLRFFSVFHPQWHLFTSTLVYLHAYSRLEGSWIIYIPNSSRNAILLFRYVWIILPFIFMFFYFWIKESFPWC